MEQRDDRLRHAEPRHESSNVVTTDEDIDTRCGQHGGDLRDAFAVDERGEWQAARVECALDDQVALREEQPGAGIVAPVGA